MEVHAYSQQDVLATGTGAQRLYLHYLFAIKMAGQKTVSELSYINLGDLMVRIDGSGVLSLSPAHGCECVMRILASNWSGTVMTSSLWIGMFGLIAI